MVGCSARFDSDNNYNDDIKHDTGGNENEIERERHIF